jgi:hypothetical protein
MKWYQVLIDMMTGRYMWLAYLDWRERGEKMSMTLQRGTAAQD